MNKAQLDNQRFKLDISSNDTSLDYSQMLYLLRFYSLENIHSWYFRLVILVAFFPILGGTSLFRIPTGVRHVLLFTIEIKKIARPLAIRIPDTSGCTHKTQATKQKSYNKTKQNINEKYFEVSQLFTVNGKLFIDS